MHEDSLKSIQKEWHGSLQGYILGFILSLLLTSCSFLLVINKTLPRNFLIMAVVSLAFIQAIVQLLFFLHIGQEEKPRWESRAFYFMLAVLLIISFGSLWIMFDLDDRMMSDMPTMEMSHD